MGNDDDLRGNAQKLPETFLVMTVNGDLTMASP